MNISLFTDNIKVFVADVSADAAERRAKLLTVLSNARLQTVVADQNTDDETVRRLIDSSDCSVHILGDEDIYNDNGIGYNTPAGVQYRIARENQNENFKMFVWNQKGLIDANNQYVNDIRRDIVENTIYSSKSSPIVFVEELRGIMSVRNKVLHEIEKKDIFFIYNDLDRRTASDILNMLEDVLSIIKLPIAMSSDTDYTEYIRNQLPGCKIGVIYYDYAGDWALSFARQIWKDNGGQSGKTPLYIVGNSDHANADSLRVFDGIIASNVNEISMIPLDVKVFFDKVTGQ
ncbi:MAG: hypothetical protein IKP73_02730 [Bacteroidales bacterium]|nr:hypothetical protein [Bacteroidales bacterium]